MAEQQHAATLGKVFGRALKGFDAVSSAAAETLAAMGKCLNAALELVALPFAEMMSALECVCALISATKSTDGDAADATGADADATAADVAEPLGALLVPLVKDVQRQLPRQRNKKKVQNNNNCFRNQRHWWGAPSPSTMEGDGAPRKYPLEVAFYSSKYADNWAQFR